MLEAVEVAVLVFGDCHGHSSNFSVDCGTPEVGFVGEFAGVVDYAADEVGRRVNEVCVARNVAASLRADERPVQTLVAVVLVGGNFHADFLADEVFPKRLRFLHRLDYEVRVRLRAAVAPDGEVGVGEGFKRLFLFPRGVVGEEFFNRAVFLFEKFRKFFRISRLALAVRLG